MSEWNLGLILCAFGVHRWFNYCCRNARAERDTQRECGRCALLDERKDQRSPWKSVMRLNRFQESDPHAQ